MSLRTVVVGCGAVAQRLYRQPLQQLGARDILRVAAVVDPVDEHAESLRSFFPHAAKHRTLDDALTTSTPDLTLLLSPAHLHCEQGVQALLAGSHVLCEKPMAKSTAECARLNDAARASKRILAVAMIRRYFPAFARLKHLLDQGQLGSLVSFEYREGHKFEWQVTTPAAFLPRKDGGTGVLFDIGPHVIDHLAWTFGDLEVLAYEDDAMAGIESNAVMSVRSTRCPGSIHLSWDSPQLNELRVTGSDGEAVLRIDRFDQLAVRRSAGYASESASVTFPADLAQPARTSLVPLTYPQAIYGQLIQVARAITLGEAPAVDGESGARCVSVLESALSIARPLGQPWLDSSEQRAFVALHWTSHQ